MTEDRLVLNKCEQVFALVNQLYGLDLREVDIRLDLSGKCAGMAQRKQGEHIIRFNYDMMKRNINLYLNNIIHHEIAHIVCFMNPSLGENHNAGWSQVCISLGGTGQCTHEELVVYSRGLTYEYNTNKGTAVRLSERMHNTVQRGGEYHYPSGKGFVTRKCPFKIVGKNGQTIE